MKRTIIFSIVTLFILFSLTSCASLEKNRRKEQFITQFFGNESVYNSLKDYYSPKDIIIYDSKKELINTPISFEINSNRIKIETTKPLNDNYFKIYSFNLNKSLASIVLATSDGDKGVIYYVEKRNNKWVIMNIISKNRY
ncbi:hypothetical protein ACM46_16940 [Chryseobacterium angstadtii]|uniref:DUF4348 domain-containing protein n=1 Tax=Chryseobacterium angstadtii TaxID=558151 RepID=A0A0J7KRT2_9FLAO|nr:hypothetical protein [Chryseobacterium angstadtii]KMQ59945.1 hypothetical protein ACM46_16940 [Chryseobacterium angstadtii]